jgi:hypothetical protein
MQIEKRKVPVKAVIVSLSGDVLNEEWVYNPVPSTPLSHLMLC